MNAEQWLKQVRKLDELIQNKLAEQEQWKELATNVSPAPFNDMPHSNTGMINNSVENAIINMISVSNEINRLIDKYIDCKQKVVATIEQLPEKEYGVLHRHYIQYMTWEDVALDMNYSTTQVWRIKNNGLKILQDVIECNAKM